MTEFNINSTQDGNIKSADIYFDLGNINIEVEDGVYYIVFVSYLKNDLKNWEFKNPILAMKKIRELGYSGKIEWKGFSTKLK